MLYNCHFPSCDHAPHYPGCRANPTDSFKTMDGAVWKFNGFDYTPTYRASRCDECNGLTTGATKSLSVYPAETVINVCGECYRQAESRGKLYVNQPVLIRTPDERRRWWFWG